MESSRLDSVKEQVLQALRHPEADEGLYLRNLRTLHEEDQRPAVNAGEDEIISALNELVAEGLVHIDESSGQVVFQIAH